MWVTKILVSKLSYQKPCNILIALLPPSLSPLSQSDVDSSQPVTNLINILRSYITTLESYLTGKYPILQP